MRERIVNKQKERTPVPEQDAQTRVGNFGEVCLGYTAEEAMNEASRCLSCKNRPCVAGCPVEVDIPSFLAAVAEGDFARGYATVKRTNSLPAICGRVCPQENQCQGRCTRGRAGDPVAVGLVERFVADWAYDNPGEVRAAVERLEAEKGHDGEPKLDGKKVALVGSGPASLTCASELLRMGAEVTLFEALHKAGGVLVYGIPEFRLPKSLVEREVGQLKEAGARIQTDAVVGKLYTVEELMGPMGYDAVFVGTGAGLPRYLGIPGEALNGVCVANELLTRVNLMRAYEFPHSKTPVFVGRNCIVVGGGNVAMDAARTAQRLGSDVTIVYRRSEQELPARAEEVAHARQEGVTFRTLANPVEARGDEKGWVKSLCCQEMELGEPDASGRRSPRAIEDSEFELPCDMLVVAIGCRTNPLLAQTTEGLATDGRDHIAVDAETCATSVPGVFAGGDATTGSATVIMAMGAGRKAAKGIADYLTRS